MTTDQIRRSMQEMELISKHFAGFHNSPETFDHECLACDHYRLTYELEQTRKHVALTMTPDAGSAFIAALIYAANRIPAEARADGAEMSHEDWLRWAAHRLIAATAAHLPHAACGTAGFHIPHAWGDPAHWCGGEPTGGDQ